MGWNIAVAFSDGFESERISEIKLAANKYNYDLKKDHKLLLEGERAGFRVFLNSPRVESHSFSDVRVYKLIKLSDKESADSWSVLTEFRRQKESAEQVDFIEFLRRAKRLFYSKSGFTIFSFFDEFDINDEVIYKYGSIEDFIKFVSLPDYWQVLLWSPVTKRAQEVDRFPVVYNIFNDTRSYDRV